jgi:hypothetical protein
MMMFSLVPMARACALFFVQRTEVEALAKSSRGAIRSFRLEFSTLRRRGEGETANRVKMRIRRRDPAAFYKWRDDGIVPLICPTCQNVFAGIAQSIQAATTMLLCMGLFSIF